MRYEKPMAMDLSARLVSGQQPLSCYSGDNPGGYNICYQGTGAYSQYWPMCVNGPGALNQDPNYQVCVAGYNAQPWCDMGTGAGSPMYDTCTAGPSDAP